jgi:hypothetical protein
VPPLDSRTLPIYTMGQVLCCHSHPSERRKLKHIQFDSESTCDDVDMYSGSPFQEESKQVLPNSDQSVNYRPSQGKQHVSSYAGVCAHMGLAPIVEETESSISKSLSSPASLKRTSITRFPKSGTMRNYQRFVTTH